MSPLEYYEDIVHCFLYRQIRDTSIPLKHAQTFYNIWLQSKGENTILQNYLTRYYSVLFSYYGINYMCMYVCMYGYTHAHTRESSLMLYVCFFIRIFSLFWSTDEVWHEPQRQKTYLWLRVPKEDSNKPADLCSLIRVFIVRMNKLCITGYPKCAQWRFWSECTNPQADLNFRWVHMYEGTFSNIVAYM